ncbi:hypothetical protein BpOF4_01960 [Alkalihalophilus pseudofirmus OF4]|uniref:Uncharacterized protein n=2 Tax=Alkalihalophilus pseudofirmus TaxID=79885 RepID=D3FV33_ALKPO|nr:hypothetical protein [Alkalihalophilus pseudofirmus]ADC48459.1 hypothetical protein BpOF4_01960 [Alkalihalophilus pseudofirmus OF4]MDV2885639.1 hypothetical protein [Alkalihalophilus pseudofirmus]WEG15948.1 hypothetical protein PQ478_15700 [Alkalihalophilus pseudofirmus]
MTKLQILQVIAVTILGIYVILAYTNYTEADWFFFIIAAINIILWVLRLRERKTNN